MKRLNNIYEQVISIDNLLLADKIARRGKSKQSGIKSFDKNFEQNIADIYRELATKTYKTSEYTTRVIRERKERLISILPYRDRVVHHAIMNVLESMFVATFTADTYSCIKGRGIHAASSALEKALQNKSETVYCLQLDIKKFYPSVDHEVLKRLLRRKIKDKEMLWLLDSIIDSAPGLPIGNYLSQYFANFYLSYFDHWIKEKKLVKYYFRYADDVVILHHDTNYLRRVIAGVTKYLKEHLNLDVKPNYRIFKVEAQGIDFVGYVHYHTHKRLRKSIKQAFARAVYKNKPWASIASYLGWAKHANCKHLIKKLKLYGTNTIIQRTRNRHIIRKPVVRAAHQVSTCFKQRNYYKGIQNRPVKISQ